MLSTIDSIRYETEAYGLFLWLTSEQAHFIPGGSARSGDDLDDVLLVFVAAVMHFDFVIDTFILEQLLHRIDATG